MRSCLFVFLFLLMEASRLLAQSSALDSIQQKTKQPIERFKDTIFGKKHTTDSAQSTIQSKIDSVGKLTQRFTHLADSLKPDLSKYNRKLDSIKVKLTLRIDSLQRLKLPAGQYSHLLDSIEKAGPLRDVKQAEAKLASLEKKVNAPVTKLSNEISKLESKVNQKLNLINKEQGANLPGNINLPAEGVSSKAGLPTFQGQGISPNLPNSNLAIPSGSIPNANLPNANLNLPSGPVPATDNPLNQINGLGNNNLPGDLKDIGKAQGEIKNITGARQEQLGKLKDSGGFGQMSKEPGQVTQIAQEAKGYKKDLKHLSKGNLDSVSQMKTLEKRAMQLADKKELDGQLTLVDQYKSMIAKGNDPMAMQRLALEQAKQQAVNHFAGKEKELQTAMSQMSKYKRKYSSLSSIKDIPKRIPNAIHGKPLIERVVPGLTFQVQKKNNVLIDLNPQVGYRFNGRLTAGAGWNERLGFYHYPHLSHKDRIYGPRTFAEFHFKKGFALRGEIEMMNTFVPPMITSSAAADPSSRQWVWGMFGGIKKEYNLSKKIRGNIQMMYNFHDRFYKTSPYADRLNVRMGFEFPMKKKIKK